MSRKSKPRPQKLTLKKVEWFSINHDRINDKFDGDLSFVNYINVGDDGDLVAAVYRAAKPNRKLGHKEFMLIWKRLAFSSETQEVSHQYMVSGMELEQIKKHTKVDGLACLECGTAMFSLNRHHFHKCGCPNDAFVDGGKDYLRFGAMKMAKTQPVTIDLLTDKIRRKPKVSSKNV